MKNGLDRLGFYRTFYICFALIFICAALTIFLPDDSPATLVFFALGAFLFGLWGLIIIYFKEIPMLLFKGKGIFAIVFGCIYLIAGWGICILIIVSTLK